MTRGRLGPKVGAKSGRGDRGPDAGAGDLLGRRQHHLSKATHATIRYRNLVGQRYLALEDSIGDAADRLEAGDTILVSQTTPALDLPCCSNRFKPLFQALSPGRREPAVRRDRPGVPG